MDTEEKTLVKRCNIAFDTLVDYTDGRLDANATARLRDHLASGCSACEANLAWLSSATQTLREAHRIQVPDRLLNRAAALYRERFPAPTPAAAPARPLWPAQLRFDSRSLGLAGARGAAAEAFELVYSTGTHDIELFQEPLEQGRWYLIGHVLPEAGDEIIVPEEVTLTAVDGERIVISPEAEEFHLPSVPAGRYDMSLRLAAGEIVLEGVGIGPQETV